MAWRELGPGSSTCFHTVHAAVSCGAVQSCNQTWDPVAQCGAHKHILCLEESSLSILSDECKKKKLCWGMGRKHHQRCSVFSGKTRQNM